jgi:hypothetical protein
MAYREAWDVGVAVRFEVNVDKSPDVCSGYFQVWPPESGRYICFGEKLIEIGSSGSR